MILIYCSHITSRKEYIFKHVFKRLMRQDFKFTSDVSEFVGHSGVKFSYGTKPLGEELFIWSHGLLDDHGIDDYEIEYHRWEELPVFFKAPNTSTIPFDIFAASFYLISRYEEYLPQVKDDIGRYSAKESVAVKGNFIMLPLVDLWVRKFLNIINQIFDATLQREQQLSTTVAIEVSSFYKYKSRGIIDNFLMLLQHVKRLKIRQAFNQIFVLLGIKPDPYNNYERLIDVIRSKWDYKRKSHISNEDMIFFFHLGSYNRVDNGTSYRYRKYQESIKKIGDYVDIGVRYSFFCDDKELKSQSKRYEQISNRPLRRTMAAYSKIVTPGHYKRLVETEKLEDYSMGYENMPGFRASTSHPFYFYDLDYEVQTPLLIHPYALHYKSMSSNMLNGQKQMVKQLKQRVKEVSGSFVIMFDYSQFEKGLKSHATTLLKYIYE